MTRRHYSSSVFLPEDVNYIRLVIAQTKSQREVKRQARARMAGRYTDEQIVQKVRYEFCRRGGALVPFAGRDGTPTPALNRLEQRAAPVNTASLTFDAEAHRASRHYRGNFDL